jgi:DNA adenine methylase
MQHEDTEQLNLKPPLKWAGGKRWLVPRLAPLWAKYPDRRLVEPFCGGLAVVLGFSPERALLNDVNPHLINFYSWLRRGLNVSISMENEEAVFYAHRQRFNHLLRMGQERSAEAAGLFYYLNRTGFNGLCRFNRQGEFNVPFGRYTRINYRRDFSAYKGVFERWEFRSGDFQKIPLGPTDFVYSDPPYDVEFTQYAKEQFGWEEQVRMAEWLSLHEGPVVLSNQATERIIRLYKRLGFKLHLVDAPRRISCTGDRTPAKEVVALKNFEVTRCGERRKGIPSGTNGSNQTTENSKGI